ncbi:superoxide dismutase [Vallitalea sp.]|jgi:Fe-Mn family superoxide dismutase|uniref:superoxide dismutase n=1 Tax=Vallitalea sp. TaxID=1882829 RepID=UPI0025F10302|nr:superoxide dismutase [Vallitalea sp.]MCT4686179.1 superoxide dismutase [Vallitalea sp.]
MYKPKVFNFNTVDGITKKQLEEHYDLYVGYINKFGEINDLLKQKDSYENPNSTYSTLRSLKKGESYSLNGIILHQLYFGNITGRKSKIHGKILDMINRDFGSYDNFVEMFTNTGLSMRGWVVLIQGEYNGKLRIIGQDSHDDGTVYNGKPILVLDVYEHAYMIDFGIDRKEYIKVFFENINWDVVNKRLEGTKIVSYR